MRNAIGISILIAAIVTASTVQAGEGQLVFRYTANETCAGGAPGTFTANGDVTNYYWMIPAIGSGVITFYPLSHSASDTNDWAYQIMPGPQPQPNGAPLNIFPARITTGSCTFLYEAGHKKSFTLQEPQAGCISTDTNGPNAGNTVTFTNGPPLRGQFAEDMQSFVAYRIAPVAGMGRFALGGQFERICMRELHGVRIPN